MNAKRESLQTAADKIKQKLSIREGSALMNALYNEFPAIYKEIVGGPGDCFVLDKLIPLFWEKFDSLVDKGEDSANFDS